MNLHVDHEDLIMCTGLHVKYQLFLSDFNATRIFSTYFPNVLRLQV
jgi:hypothetical protein